MRSAVAVSRAKKSGAARGAQGECTCSRECRPASIALDFLVGRASSMFDDHRLVPLPLCAIASSTTAIVLAVDRQYLDGTALDSIFSAGRGRLHERQNPAACSRGPLMGNFAAGPEDMRLAITMPGAAAFEGRRLRCSGPAPRSSGALFALPERALRRNGRAANPAIASRLLQTEANPRFAGEEPVYQAFSRWDARPPYLDAGT